MIIVTDGEERFVIEKKQLWERKSYFRGLATKLKYSYWGIELLFVKNGLNTYEKIIKCFPDGDSIEKEYINLDKNKKNIVLLSNEDYIEVKTIFGNINSDIDYKTEAFIEIGAVLLSFEYYQNCILELDEYSLETVFRDFIVVNNNEEYSKYEREILARSKEILKERYNVTNINLESKEG